MNKYRLNEDIISTFKKGVIYGKKGDIVTEISRSDQTLAVQGKKEAYSVNINKLTKIN